MKLRRVCKTKQGLTSEVVEKSSADDFKLEKIMPDWDGYSIYSADLSEEKEKQLKEKLLKRLFNKNKKYLSEYRFCVRQCEMHRDHLLTIAEEHGVTLK